jgi:glucosamine 6-phosphate synthetase-like amidotransferase/phosphosugar isomerase protein
MIGAVIANVTKFLIENKNLEGIFEIINEKFGNEYRFIQILARGSSMSSAHQAALYFKEIVKISSEATTISTFRHGGIESLNDQTKMIIIASNPSENEISIQFIKKLIEDWTFGTLLYITNQELKIEHKHLFTNPKVILYQHNIKHPFLSHIYEIIILELMCYKTAVKRGMTPGLFNFSTKITSRM